MTRLFILAGPDKGRSFDLAGDSFHIGRAQDNDIIINDGTVSRKHLKLTIRSGKYFITDLQSFNGTFFDGEYVTPGLEVEAREGIPIVLGMSVIGIGESSIKHVMPFLDAIELDRETAKESGIFKIHKNRTNQKKLEMLYKVSNVLTENLSIHTTLTKILEFTFDLLGDIDRGTFILFDSNWKVTHLISQSTQSNDDPTKRFCKDVVRRVIVSKMPLVISNLESAEDDDIVDTLKVLRIQSVMCIPLITGGQIIGVIYVDSLGRPYGFTHEDLSFFMDLSRRTAVAIETARFAFDLTKMPDDTPGSPAE